MSPLVSQPPTCARQCIWQNPPTLSPSLWDHVQWPTPTQHQACRICSTGDTFRVLPTHSVFGSMRLFQPFSLPHRSIHGPWLRKERNVKENVPAPRWCLKKSETHQYPCREAMKPLQDKILPRWISPVNILLLPPGFLAAILQLVLPFNGCLIFVFPWFHLCRNVSEVGSE